MKIPCPIFKGGYPTSVSRFHWTSVVGPREASWRSTPTFFAVLFDQRSYGVGMGQPGLLLYTYTYNSTSQLEAWNIMRCP